MSVNRTVASARPSSPRRRIGASLDLLGPEGNPSEAYCPRDFGNDLRERVEVAKDVIARPDQARCSDTRNRAPRGSAGSYAIDPPKASTSRLQSASPSPD